MFDKKEVKILMKYAKRILNHSMYKKLKKVRDEDKTETVHHFIKTALLNAYDDLNQKAIELKKQKKDVFIIETKMNLLGSKIKLFSATFHEQDFIQMKKLFKQVRKEMKNV
jgi:hypothetical protein